MTININLNDLLRPRQPMPNFYFSNGRLPSDWKQTYTGRAIVVSEPDDESVCLTDLIMGIAGINRYDGQNRFNWDVAAHSMLALGMATEDMMNDGVPLNPIHLVDILLHDAHEYVIGDITTPTANGFESRLPGFREMVSTLKGEWDIAIYTALGLPPIAGSDDALERESIVKEYDMKALFAERDVLLPNWPAPWGAEDVYASIPEQYPNARRFILGFCRSSRLEHAAHFLMDLHQATKTLEKSGFKNDGYRPGDVRQAIARTSSHLDYIKVMESELAELPQTPSAFGEDDGTEIPGVLENVGSPGLDCTGLVQSIAAIFGKTYEEVAADLDAATKSFDPFLQRMLDAGAIDQEQVDALKAGEPPGCMCPSCRPDLHGADDFL